MNRGARHQAIFLDDVDRHEFLNALGQMCERYDVEVHAYCLMGDHYHLLLRLPLGNVSLAIQHFASVYTQRFNRRHGFDGALFRGRFHSVPVGTDEQLMTVSRYIHRNPTDIDGGTSVERYRWSSLSSYLTPQVVGPIPAWLHVDFTLRLFGGSMERYRSFVADHAEAERASVTTMPLRRPPGPANVHRRVALIQRPSRTFTVRVQPDHDDKHEPNPP